MAHTARAGSRGPAPRPDLALAPDCPECYGWGTVVTPENRHELCPACQHPTIAPSPPLTSPQWPKDGGLPGVRRV
jgi:hypothetical protein